MTSSSLQASVALSGLQATKGGLRISSDAVRRLDIPRRIEAADLQRCQRDCELLAAKLGADPAQALALFKSILQGDVTRGRQIADELGISEDKFIAEGGGFIWIVVVVVLLYATDAF